MSSSQGANPWPRTPGKPAAKCHTTQTWPSLHAVFYEGRRLLHLKQRPRLRSHAGCSYQPVVIARGAFKVLSTENACDFPGQIQRADTQEGQRGTLPPIFTADPSPRRQGGRDKSTLTMRCATEPQASRPPSSPARPGLAGPGRRPAQPLEAGRPAGGQK